ncbi:hypothetical protein [Pseudoxanthomonas mexicana]
MKRSHMMDALLELSMAFALGAALSLVLFAGEAKASDTSSKHYGRQGALRSNDVQFGQVVMVRSVTIENRSKANAGTAIGSAVGYGAARQVKNRDARSAARIAGGVIGGVAGDAVNNRLTKRDGIEVFVRTTGKRGQMEVISIVQDADVIVRTGDNVLLVGSGRDMRVVPAYDLPQSGGYSRSCGPAECGSLRGEP